MFRSNSIKITNNRNRSTSQTITVMAPSAVTTVETHYSFVNANKLNGVHFGLKGVESPKTLIGEALQKRVESIDSESCKAGEEDAFFVADLGDVYRQHMRFKLNLPRVRPFYGMFIHLK